ncbi:MAG TPA: hypothetical protein VM390_05740 [Acidimicrobiales bacterium]|nr:hypothetical protein [Acidimicrobiales bacterium]
METFIVRVWLPDRPGALGAVASRIGALRGDVVGIEILERGGGRAIDELVVQLPDATVMGLLVSEIAEVDGVDVEDVRPAPGAPADQRLDALDTAAVLVGATTQAALIGELVARAHEVFEAEWAAAVDTERALVAAAVGSPPPAAWLAAFVAGSRSSALVAAGDRGPDDAAWSALEGTAVAVVLGRRGRPFRARERRELSALARIAGLRACELDRVGAVRH